MAQDYHTSNLKGQVDLPCRQAIFEHHMQGQSGQNKCRQPQIKERL